jgi:uncharacterized membrane protein (UPF0127 family)
MMPAHYRNAIISILYCILFPFLAQHAHADMIFARASIRIEPVMRAVDDSTAFEVRSVSDYTVEMRGQDALRMDSLQSLNTLMPGSGLLIVLNAPSTAPVPFYRDFIPLDIVLIAEDGTILKTAETITLGSQQEPIASVDPAKAFLFLPAGTLAAKKIQAGDVVQGSMFITDVAPPRPQ